MIICPRCGVPNEAEIFDHSQIFHIQTDGDTDTSGIEKARLDAGDSIELARFELQLEQRAVLLYFSQFTDRYASNPRDVLTPGYQWQILVNDYPVSPWLTFDHIINPWGMAGFPLAQHLTAESTIRFVIQNIDVAQTDTSRWLRRVGGRIVGMYWVDCEHRGRQSLSTRQAW